MFSSPCRVHCAVEDARGETVEGPCMVIWKAQVEAKKSEIRVNLEVGPLELMTRYEMPEL